MLRAELLGQSLNRSIGLKQLSLRVDNSKVNYCIIYWNSTLPHPAHYTARKCSLFFVLCECKFAKKDGSKVGPNFSVQYFKRLKFAKKRLESNLYIMQEYSVVHENEMQHKNSNFQSVKNNQKQLIRALRFFVQNFQVARIRILGGLSGF